MSRRRRSRAPTRPSIEPRSRCLRHHELVGDHHRLAGRHACRRGHPRGGRHAAPDEPAPAVVAAHRHPGAGRLAAARLPADSAPWTGCRRRWSPRGHEARRQVAEACSYFQTSRAMYRSLRVLQPLVPATAASTPTAINRPIHLLARIAPSPHQAWHGSGASAVIARTEVPATEATQPYLTMEAWQPRNGRQMALATRRYDGRKGGWPEGLSGCPGRRDS